MRRLFAFLLTVGLIAAIATTSVTYLRRRQAENLARDVAGLQVGRSSAEQVLLLAERHGAERLDDPCPPENCHYYVEVENTPLFWLALAPWTGYKVRLRTENGRLVFVDSVLATDNRGFLFSARRLLVGSAKLEGAFARIARSVREDDTVSIQFSSPGQPSKIMANLTANSKPNYALNLTCLSQIGGCRDARELFPAAWEDPGNQWQIDGFEPSVK